MPVDNPTVAAAEVTSKRISSSEKSVVVAKTKVVNKIAVVLSATKVRA
jgi:hypothetical protein